MKQKLEELKQSGVADYIQEIRTSNDPMPKGKIDVAALKARAAQDSQTEALDQAEEFKEEEKGINMYK